MAVYLSRTNNVLIYFETLFTLILFYSWPSWPYAVSCLPTPFTSLSIVKSWPLIERGKGSKRLPSIGSAHRRLAWLTDIERESFGRIYDQWLHFSIGGGFICRSHPRVIFCLFRKFILFWWGWMQSTEFYVGDSDWTLTSPARNTSIANAIRKVNKQKCALKWWRGEEWWRTDST